MRFTEARSWYVHCNPYSQQAQRICPSSLELGRRGRPYDAVTAAAFAMAKREKKMRKQPFTTLAAWAGLASVAVSGCGGDGFADPSTGADIGSSAARLTAPGEACGTTLAPRTRFFLPQAVPGAAEQIADLKKAREFGLAARLAALEATPQAAWFTGGSPDDVQSAVHDTMAASARDHTVPILVAYNIPFRDCAQYSAGGAVDTAAYEAWIDGFARGIGRGTAVIIVEPDGLGVIPYNTSINGTAEWCKPTVTDAGGNTVPAPGATPSERYVQLNYAVDSVAHKAPNALVYLDGTHSGWQPVGEAAYRLVHAGVQRAQGFFVNVSNFQPTPQLAQYATWIAKCIYYANSAAEGGWRVGHYDYCASQYYPASPQDYGTWSLTDKWYTDNVDNAANPPSGPSALKHFVIDTGRNGQGPFDAAAYTAAPYNQPAGVIGGLNGGSWCNPKGAGVGFRPTADTGVPLADAYLWVKTPGGSDGSCDIAGGARAWDYGQYNPWAILGDKQNHFDPLWGVVDPDAGAWFPAQALELAVKANPPLLR
jgi:endoglucanase